MRYFAEKYIELKNNFNSKIPLSDGCKAFRKAYVDDQKTELSKFFDLYVDENISGGSEYKIKTHDLFRRFCQYADIELDDKDKPVGSSKWSLTSFTKAILTDHVGVHVKQIKENGYPVQFYTGLKLKEGAENTLPASVQNDMFAAQAPANQQYANDDFDMPDENPF